RGLGVGATPARNLTTLGEGQRNRGDLLADREFLVQLVPGPDQALVERILDRPPDRVGGSLAYPVELRLGPLRGVRHRRAGALHAAFEAVERSPLRGDRRADHVLGTPPVEVGGVPGLAHRVAGALHAGVQASHRDALTLGGGPDRVLRPTPVEHRAVAGSPQVVAGPAHTLVESAHGAALTLHRGADGVLRATPVVDRAVAGIAQLL